MQKSLIPNQPAFRSVMTELSHHPLANIFPLLAGANFQELVDDIRANGLREPITLFEGTILDGRNRYRACTEAAVEPRFETYLGDDPLAYVISLKVKRRHLDESQRACAARLSWRRAPFKNRANLRVISGIRWRYLNVSRRSVQSARKVIDEATPELQKTVDQGAIKVSVAAELATLPPEKQRGAAADPKTAPHLAKKVKRADREAELGDKQAALLSRKYGVIVADPEWRFEPWSRKTGMDRAADNHYPTSCIEVIAARDVASIAADDCVPFLWATAPMLPHALAVMEAWGFDYRSNVVWAKDRIGTGYWFRNKHEHLLIGVKGSIPAPAMGTQCPSLIEASVPEHSAKPECFLEMIEQYFPSLPKIELNRRGPARAGRDAWGNEARAAC
jgi:N6-adenosine-specific RNA methylase IME4